MKIIARASNNIQDLKGDGLEYLLDQEGNVVAAFYDGNLGTEAPKCYSIFEDEETLRLAA